MRGERTLHCQGQCQICQRVAQKIGANWFGPGGQCAVQHAIDPQFVGLRLRNLNQVALVQILYGLPYIHVMAIQTISRTSYAIDARFVARGRVPQASEVGLAP